MLRTGLIQSTFMRQSMLHSTIRSRINKEQNIDTKMFMTEDRLRKSAQMSYIGKMSGNNDVQVRNNTKLTLFASDIKQQNEQEDTFAIKRRRIPFSKIVAPSPEQSLCYDETTMYLNVRSFTDSNDNSVENNYSWSFCAENSSINICRCVIQDSTFTLFKKNDKNVFQEYFASINFDTVVVKLQKPAMKYQNYFRIKAGMYTIELQHDNLKVIQYWFKQLTNLQSNSRGFQFPLTVLENKEEFYKCRYQTQEYFVNNCQTGDLLLFQDNHFFAKLQRFVTRSNFDHVGMVVKNQSQQIFVFQANSGSGVVLTPWKYVVNYRWYKTIPRIVWRRLKEVDRDFFFKEALQKFLMINLDKKYNISLDKIMSAVSYIAPPSNHTSIDEKDKQKEVGFFCSELIATIYKDLGLISRDTKKSNYLPACQFYPKDFSQKSGRKLDNGCLQPEYQICFDPELLKLQYKVY